MKMGITNKRTIVNRIEYKEYDTDLQEIVCDFTEKTRVMFHEYGSGGHYMWQPNVVKAYFPVLLKEPKFKILEEPQCDCICQGQLFPHLHFIMFYKGTDRQLRNRLAYLVRKYNLPFRKVGKNSSGCMGIKDFAHLHGAINYILGPDSKGKEKKTKHWILGAHTNRKFKHGLPSRRDHNMIEAKMRQKHPEINNERIRYAKSRQPVKKTDEEKAESEKRARANGTWIENKYISEEFMELY
jgi:hypothetical protein